MHKTPYGNLFLSYGRELKVTSHLTTKILMTVRYIVLFASL